MKPLKVGQLMRRRSTRASSKLSECSDAPKFKIGDLVRLNPGKEASTLDAWVCLDDDKRELNLRRGDTGIVRAISPHNQYNGVDVFFWEHRRCVPGLVREALELVDV